MLNRATVWILTAVISAYAGAGPSSVRAIRTPFSITRSVENLDQQPMRRFKRLRLFFAKLVQEPGYSDPFLTRIASHSLYNRPPPQFITAG